MSAALAELRRATREAHESLEARIDVFPSCRDRQSYTSLLQGFWTVHSALEPALTEAIGRLSLQPRWHRQDVLPRLAADLTDLGVNPAPPAGPSPPSFSTADDVWGCLYVVEGSALGGGLIAAEVQRLPGDLPCRFFTGAGEGRGRRWREFRRHLEAWLEGKGDATAVTVGALRTFDHFASACAPPDLRQPG